MIVSVCMITYNHEDYIEQAINGVLMQQRNFILELIISNDCSSDASHKIIHNIINNHTKSIIIKYFNHNKNKGMMDNFIFTLKKCSGKYIAVCEGDDYWTDPLKLQKQVDFLEANTDYSICFHKVKLLSGNDIRDADDITISRYNEIDNLPIDVNDLLRHGNFIHTPSVLFRNQIMDLPFEFNFSPIGDYLLYIIVSQKGFIKRLDDTMAVYRKGTGIYSTLDDLTFNKNMLIYQSCILSFLIKKNQREILLKRQIELINSHIKNINQQIPNEEILLKLFSFKKLIRLIILKIKNRVIKK